MGWHIDDELHVCLVWATVFVGAQHDNGRTLLNLLIPITGDEVSLVQH